MVGGYSENPENHKTVKIWGWVLAWVWALAQDNTVNNFFLLADENDGNPEGANVGGVVGGVVGGIVAAAVVVVGFLVAVVAVVYKRKKVSCFCFVTDYSVDQYNDT